MKDTRVEILDDLEHWASDNAGPRVCWLSGMAGIGKSSIALTLSERLDDKLMLGASFFCSHSSDNARLIVPTIAYMLGRVSPTIRSAISRVLVNNPDVAFDTLLQQFRYLVVQPVQDTIPDSVKLYKVVVIDALDECSDLSTVELFIKAVLTYSFQIPLKFLITSRPESRIRNAFRHLCARSPEIEALREIPLHDIPKAIVQDDIRTYLRHSLFEIAERDVFSQSTSDWPSEREFSILLDRSNGLFIYAATAVRYIDASDVDFRERLADVTCMEPFHALQTEEIDSLYQHIITKAFVRIMPRELSRRSDVLAAIICLQTPLSIDAIASLLNLERRDIQVALSPLHSVLHVPEHGQVEVFHASFRDFILDRTRSTVYSVDSSDAHHKLVGKCLKCLNTSLRYNITNSPECTMVGVLPYEIADPSIIPDSLRYSGLYWASHLAETLAHPPTDVTLLLNHLCTFSNEHILHWFECLSALRQLESGLKSLVKAQEATFVSTHCGEMLQLNDFAEILPDPR